MIRSRPSSTTTGTSAITDLGPPPGDGRCRACGAPAIRPVLDLGAQPESGAFPTPAEADAGLPTWLLRLGVCGACWWLQLIDDTPDEPDLGEPSAVAASSTIREHAQGLAGWLRDELGIPPTARVLEVASHGNVLGGVLRARGLADTLTVERHPAAAAAARTEGLAVVDGMLGPELARTLVADGPFDLALDTFDLSHRRAPGEELAALAIAIGERGLAVIEVEHALPLLAGARFDSVRHGHFGYVSLLSLQVAARRAGLDVVRAMRSDLYGGALRVVLAAQGRLPIDPSVRAILEEELAAGLATYAPYDAFRARVDAGIATLRAHLAEARAAGQKVLAYGAPTRGNTLLNTAGIDRDWIGLTADASPAKHGRELPGSRIPIVDPATLVAAAPDEVLILPWPIADEIVDQLRAGGLRDTRFLVALPELRVVERP